MRMPVAKQWTIIKIMLVFDQLGSVLLYKLIMRDLINVLLLVFLCIPSNVINQVKHKVEDIQAIPALASVIVHRVLSLDLFPKQYVVYDQQCSFEGVSFVRSLCHYLSDITKLIKQRSFFVLSVLICIEMSSQLGSSFGLSYVETRSHRVIIGCFVQALG